MGGSGSWRSGWIDDSRTIPELQLAGHSIYATEDINWLHQTFFARASLLLSCRAVLAQQRPCPTTSDMPMAMAGRRM